MQSILFVLVVMIGGAGSVAGPLVGAIVVGVLPELLSNLEDVRLLVFGAMLLVVLWIAPDGVVGLLAPRPPPLVAGDGRRRARLAGVSRPASRRGRGWGSKRRR